MAERAVVVIEPFDQLTARADVGRDGRHTSRVAFEDDQRQSFADRRENGQADFRQQILDLLETEKFHALGEPETFGEVAAFLGVSRIFVFGPGDPGLGFGQLVEYPAHGTDEGLDVLDRHHATDQA